MTDAMLEKLWNINLANTEILDVSHEEDEFWDITDVPAFTRVHWKNSFGADSVILSEIWIPDDWNGRFVVCGSGGMAGALSRPLLAVYARQGYAVAHTNMGTGNGRTRGIGNPDVWNDFGWRSTHMMAVVGKALIAECCGKAPDYSYFLGASTGGNQAMQMVQRFPDDYDGVLAGVPAHNRAFLHIYMVWMHNHLTTRDGRALFSDEEIPPITAAAEAFFAEYGFGEAGDTFVTYPYIGEDTVDRFLSYLHEREPSYTEEQLAALHAVYEGPRDPVTGRQIYNGMPIGSEIYGCGIHDSQQSEPPFFDPFLWVFGADFCSHDFDFHRDTEIFGDAISPVMSANNPDLSPFFSHGGKLLSYSATSDPCVPFPDAMRYCERVWEKCGGYDAVSQCYRWFLVPGMDHNFGGHGLNALWADEEQHDLFWALRRWTEDGVAPDALVGAHIDGDRTEFTRCLYPYGSDRFPKTEHVLTCDEYYLAK